MGDAADDYFDAMERNADRLEAARASILRDCPQWDCEPRLFRNSDGFLECKQCGETFDE